MASAIISFLDTKNVPPVCGFLDCSLTKEAPAVFHRGSEIDYRQIRTIVQLRRASAGRPGVRTGNNVGGAVLMLGIQRNTRRSAMRILPFMLAIFVVTAGVGTPAQAQNYPWCADYAGFGSQNCGFTTFQQCLAALSGNGGFCNANTQYVPPAEPVTRIHKHS